MKRSDFTNRSDLINELLPVKAPGVFGERFVFPDEENVTREDLEEIDTLIRKRAESFIDAKYHGCIQFHAKSDKHGNLVWAAWSCRIELEEQP